jgi:hypothetical protein
MVMMPTYGTGKFPTLSAYVRAASIAQPPFSRAWGKVRELRSGSWIVLHHSHASVMSWQCFHYSLGHEPAAGLLTAYDHLEISVIISQQPLTTTPA